MGSVTPVLREFFNRYERTRNTFDIHEIDTPYPDTFMFAGPSGVRIAEKAGVLAGLAKGHQLFKTLGHRSIKLVSLSETALDEH